MEKSIEKSRSFALSQIAAADPDTRSLAQRIQKDRPYKTPKGYLRWDEYCIELAMCLQGMARQTGDMASRIHYNRSSIWLAQNAPLYIVEKELLRQLQGTDLPDGPSRLLAGLPSPSIRSAIFFLPMNSIKSPDGGSVDSIVFHYSELAEPDYSKGNYNGYVAPHLNHKDGHPVNIHWSTVDSRTTVWFGGAYVSHQGELIEEAINVGISEMSDADHAFTASVRTLAIQIWLAASFIPSVTPAEKSPSPASQTGRPAPKSKFWTPRRLTMPKTSDRTPSPKTSTGSHASPHAHWRRGHWRNAPVGAGRSERKLVWIRPTLINPER